MDNEEGGGQPQWLAQGLGWGPRKLRELKTFFVEVKSELKKVTWPSRNEVYSTTIVVILTTIFFGFYLYGLDLVLSQLFTGQRHGIERFTNGLGSPGSRNDVWDSDEFRKAAPKLANIAKVMVLPPAPDMLPWYYPANGRFAEVDTVLINEWVKVTLGQISVDTFAEDTGKQIQAIMDKPTV